MARAGCAIYRRTERVRRSQIMKCTWVLDTAFAMFVQSLSSVVLLWCMNAAEISAMHAFPMSRIEKLHFAPIDFLVLAIVVYLSCFGFFRWVHTREHLQIYHVSKNTTDR
jgi:uncharacterized BrkB/YihY/UPF0761 family membrane protein